METIPTEVLNALRDGAAWAFMHPWLFWGFLGAVAVNNGLRYGWKWNEMPRWARVVVGITDLPALNVWAVFHRFGVKRQTDEVSPEVVRAAEKTP